MNLSAREIQVILEALGRDEVGYSSNPEVGRLQAKLSIMQQVRVQMGDDPNPPTKGH